MIGVVAKLSIQPGKEAEFEQTGRDLMAKVKAKEKAILDGTFTVKVDDGQPKSTAK